MEPLYQRAPRRNRRPAERGPRSDPTPAALIALVLLAVPGCADEPELPPIVWEGDYLRFGTDADEEICAGTLPYLDGVTGHLGEVFGHPGRKVDYYWLPDGIEEHCGEEGLLGCVNYEPVVYSRILHHQHELVHAVRAPETLYMPLEEGLAEVYGDDWPNDPVQGDIADILREHENGKLMPARAFPRAGHFMSYLLEEHGLEKVQDIEKRTSYADSYANAQRAFRESTGESIDDEVERYESTYPRCDARFYRNTDYECSQNVVSAPTVVGEEVRGTVSLSCDDPAVLGPRDGHQWTTITLDVQTPGLYFIFAGKADYEFSWSILMKECSMSCLDLLDNAPRYDSQLISGRTCLDRSRYIFRFTDDNDFDEFEYLVRLVEPSCD